MLGTLYSSSQFHSPPSSQISWGQSSMPLNYEWSVPTTPRSEHGGSRKCLRTKENFNFESSIPYSSNGWSTDWSRRRSVESPTAPSYGTSFKSTYTTPEMNSFQEQHSGYRPTLPSVSRVNQHDFLRGSDYSTTTSDYNGFQSRRTDRVENGSFVHSSSPAPQFESQPHAGDHSREKIMAGSAIHPYLQLPSTIASSKGSLAEFAAQITCLFWFESSSTLTQIENMDFSLLVANGPNAEAQPSTGYLKWVTTILSTTQVTQNVILLALLFIYRLKKSNPSVKGKPGSEFRLLTVALMLGNKFLDDNTYTNKTWAEVSGISVQEIHVMEVEFLSHMKYDLYTSKKDWEQWHRQLGTFHMYFERAAYIQRTMPLRHSALQSSPTLPSPPASNAASPPYGPQLSPLATSFNNSLNIPPHMSGVNLSPAASLPDLEFRPNGRKRSWDESSFEPPPKRQVHYRPYPSGPPISQSIMAPSLPLPIPSLPIPTNQLGQPQVPITNLQAAAVNRNMAVNLPPFSWSQPSASQPALTLPHPTTVNNLTNTYESSPRRQIQIGSTSRINSPAYSNYPSAGSHTLSQNHNSPSYFLTQRTSPYRPVRNISTLLAAPSSGQMQQAEAPMSHDQMQWQPLGKLADRPRTGRVPYLHRDAWPETHQVDQWTPSFSLPING